MSAIVSCSGPPVAWMTTAFIQILPFRPHWSSATFMRALARRLLHTDRGNPQEGSDGYRRIHPDREQWLADFDDLAAIHAHLRAQQADRAEGRALRPRFCPFHDQA